MTYKEFTVYVSRIRRKKKHSSPTEREQHTSPPRIADEPLPKVNAADPFHKPFLSAIEAAARTLNFELKILLSRGADPFPESFAEVAGSGVQAMMVQPSLPRERAAELALRYGLPLFVASAEFAQAGALMAYGADNVAVYRQSATFVDKILKGRKPADLPVELATKFLLVVNLKAANALGITLSPTLLNRADQVIE